MCKKWLFGDQHSSKYILLCSTKESLTSLEWQGGEYTTKLNKSILATTITHHLRKIFQQCAWWTRPTVKKSFRENHHTHANTPCWLCLTSVKIPVGRYHPRALPVLHRDRTTLGEENTLRALRKRVGSVRSEPDGCMRSRCASAVSQNADPAAEERHDSITHFFTTGGTGRHGIQVEREEINQIKKSG